MEQVLSVKAEKLGRHLEQEGLVTQGTEEILRLILENYEFVPRPQAEEDASFRQIIPYIVIRRAGKILLLERLKTQTEKRLHGKMSIGVGGHINPIDCAAADVLRAGLERELYEEANVEQVKNLRFLGIINDYSSPVSFYHLGLLYLLDAEGEVSVRETSKMCGRFAAPEELAALADSMETWSQVVIRSVDFDNL